MSEAFIWDIYMKHLNLPDFLKLPFSSIKKQLNFKSWQGSPDLVLF